MNVFNRSRDSFPMWINWSATSILNRVFILSSREFRIAVWAAKSVVGCAEVVCAGEVSSQPEGVDGLAGVEDSCGVDTFPC